MSKLSPANSAAIEFIAKAVHDVVGIQLGANQRVMIESRLTRRMQELKLTDWTDYLTFFKQHRAEELENLVSILTTHHSFFFREFTHFEYLLEKCLPNMIAAAKTRADKKIRIWSAACSRGQEVYSIAMFLDYHLKRMASGVTYEILGSDVDSKSVKIAQNGVYRRDELKEVPLTMLADHWARGVGDIADFAKVRDSIRSHCRFETRNLLTYRAQAEKFDLIFCRNVFIYFEPHQIQAMSRELVQSLTEEGAFFIGVSETLSNLDVPVTSVGPSIYRRAGAKGQVAPAAKAAVAEAPKALTRVLCVDDSPSILKLMKMILTKEFGFEVVGTAGNGLEAAAAVRQLKPDIMTLDLHMPEQGGLDYLRANHSPVHCPVIVVSSVSREEQSLAFEALKLGAADYVEKPELADMQKRADEIRKKLRVALSAGPATGKRDLGFEQQFVRAEPPASQEALRILIARTSDHERLVSTLKDMRHQTNKTLVLWIDERASSTELKKASEVLASACGGKLVWTDSAEKAFTDKAQPITQVLVAGSCAMILPGLKRLAEKVQTSIVLFSPQDKDQALLQNWPTAQVLLEDRGRVDAQTWTSKVGRKVEVVPATSFAYMSSLHCSKRAA